MKAFWKIIALLIGLALFGWYLSRTDLRAVAEVLSRLGWLAPLALVPYLIVYIVDCIGWRFCLPSGLKIPFFVLFCIRWAGEAVNNVLPSGYVGGEAVKVYLLRRRAVAAGTGTSSVVVGRTAQTTAQLLYISVASIALMHLASHQPGLRPALLMIVTCATLVLIALFWVQSRGLFSCALAVFRVLRLKLAWIEHRRAKILELDHAITGFYRHHRSRFFASTAFYFGGWLLDTLEIYLVAYLLGMPVTWPQALAVEAFTSVVKIIGLWVPGTLGVQESGILMLGRLVGFPDTLSVAYALLRRAREVIFAGIGWLLLYVDHASLQKIKTESSSSVLSPTKISPNP